MKRILVGSRAFFGKYRDFKFSNFDFVELDESENVEQFELVRRGISIFRVKLESVENMVKRAIVSGGTLQAGKFLVKEVAESIGATVEDILPLEPVFAAAEGKYTYLYNIFAALKDNGSFKITDEQREEAYRVYKEARSYDLL